MSAQKIILFDGWCNFCDSFINFTVKRDHKKLFKLCFLQSESAQKLGQKYDFLRELENLNSLIFIKDEKVFRKSDAAIEILNQLGGAWRLICLLLLFPKSWRDFFYDWFGKNRYRFFGKKNSCEISSTKIHERIYRD